MWTWTFEAHEFTHDNNNNRVIALFSLSHPKEKNIKRNPFYEFFFFTACERDVSSGGF